MDYKQYFEIHNRLVGKKKIAIIKTDALNAFIEALVNDNSIDTQTRVFILVSLSGGMRVNEALEIRKEDFSVDGEKVFVEINVLKKRKAGERRTVKIHPTAAPLVTEWLKGVAGKPFKFTERTALNRIKAVVGLDEVCNHSLRHSLISLMLFGLVDEKGNAKQVSHMFVSKLLKVGVESIEHYSVALNQKKAWDQVF